MFRQTWLNETIVELTDSLISDYDVVEFIEVLIARCVELLDAAEIGIMLCEEDGLVRELASSSGRMTTLKLLEMQTEEGPCYDCITSGKQVDSVLLGDEALARWPKFQPAAVAAGYQQILALPMRLRESTIGAVAIFYKEPPELASADLSLAQAFASIATIAIIQERSSSDSKTVVNQLKGALTSRIVIEQAKGMLALQNDISLDEAFTLLRTQSRNQNRRLTELAHEIVARQDAG